MNSSQIRERFLKFFEARGHKIIPSASLVPENDPTTLFTGSGMQPMVPYLLGERHPQGTRVADSQKSFRTGDIEEVGDNRHTTFFEMLGNWSFGDYFKEDQLTWISQFLFDELKLDPQKLFVTVFSGDELNGLPKDTEAAEIWKKIFKERGIEAETAEMGSEQNASKIGMGDARIFFYSHKNWWSRAGIPGQMPIGEPGGPDSEMFYEFSNIEHNPKFGEHCHPNCDCGRYLEIGNSVFMTYRKTGEGLFESLPSKNIDFGGGLERMCMAVNDNSDIVKVNHKPILDHLEKASGKKYGQEEGETRAFRIVSDHMKAAAFLIADGVLPSNSERGYFVRRLLRRAVRYADLLSIEHNTLAHTVQVIAEMYKDAYPEISDNKMEVIVEVVVKEESAFRKTLEQGLKQFEKGVLDPFVLFTTYGFPIELTEEIAKEKGITIDREKFEEDFKKHQELSRVGSEQKFKGGLGDTSEMSVKYHTATHLLHQALHDVLGNEVMQKGSNITPERLRFDFAFSRKMTDEEKKRVEEIVNEKISQDLPVNKVVLPKAEAEKSGAYHFFGEKYPDEVSVYFVGESLEGAYSKEFCGGPHVERIGTLGKFRITKEEAVSAGTRRIKAVLE